MALTLFTNICFGQSLLPGNMIKLDTFFSHHVLIAEKSTHKLHVFENKEGRPELVKTYLMTTGKNTGNKSFSGDFRTPEGIYFIQEFLTRETLLKRYGKEGEIYGVGAFTLSYPNPMDAGQGKSGGGIWIHSTNDETRIEKGLDSRGCIVTYNNDLKEISQYLELNRTQVIVVQDMHFIKEETHQSIKKNIEEALNSWIDAWKKKDIEVYLSHYSKTDFKDKTHFNYARYAAYKKSVFSNPGTPKINATDFSILMNDQYVTVVFKQDYQSATINDIGMKTLYLKKDDYYKWKIVSESWSKIGPNPNPNPNSEFKPSMRFFN
jgi:murein L,D-transpeptidase YafK